MKYVGSGSGSASLLITKSKLNQYPKSVSKMFRIRQARDPRSTRYHHTRHEIRLYHPHDIPKEKHTKDAELERRRYKDKDTRN